MSTIASDGKTIAADGKAVTGHEVTCLKREKMRSGPGCIYALTGDSAFFVPMIDWYEAGANPKELPCGTGVDWAFLVVRMRGVERYTSGHAYPVVWGFPVAEGSGAQLAMGAILAGCTPKRAVEIAALRDIYTGGEIAVMTIPAELPVVLMVPSASSNGKVAVA